MPRRKQDIRARRTYFPDESRLLQSLIEAALEAGLPASDSVRLAIGIYKEIDVLARTRDLQSFPRSSLTTVREYARAILRSGSTFSSYEIATRAIMAFEQAERALDELHREWRYEDVTKRLQDRRQRQERAQSQVDFQRVGDLP